MIAALCALLSAVMAVTPAPKDVLAARMILTEIVQDGDAQKSAGRSDAGQCKQYQINAFAQASAGYMLADYPDARLYLPFEHNNSETSGRPVGAAWDMPGPETGNAYVEAARFDYDKALTKKENIAVAKAFLSNVRAGDLLQMQATYSSGGRGTHTLMFTRPYDPRLPSLYWSDSNFANRIVDGVRYGVARAYQTWPLEEVAGWIAADWYHGATLYRLRDDIAVRQ